MTLIASKKSLGQNFLFNPSTIDKILEKAKVTSEDKILEIGPGPGVMTEALLKKAAQVVVVEKDHRFASLLRERLESAGHFTLIEGDFLETQLSEILHEGSAKWKVVANLPYNIATEVIFRLLDHPELFQALYLMVQKEVAERLVARPETSNPKDYGVLSVMSQIRSDNRIVMRLPPGAFSPPPKVHAAIVEFQISERIRYPIRDLALFKSVVRAAFAQRRKMIRNTLRLGLPQWSEEALVQALETAGIKPADRAETVSIDHFVRLANALSNV